jgi:hypothetical protein
MTAVFKCEDDSMCFAPRLQLFVARTRAIQAGKLQNLRCLRNRSSFQDSRLSVVGKFRKHGDSDTTADSEGSIPGPELCVVHCQA